MIRKVAALLAALIVSTGSMLAIPKAQAQVPSNEMQLTWTCPTERTDGEPLLNNEIEFINVHFGQNTNVTGQVSLARSCNPGTDGTYTLAGLNDGLWYATVSAVDTLELNICNLLIMNHFLMFLLRQFILLIIAQTGT